MRRVNWAFVAIDGRAHIKRTVVDRSSVPGHIVEYFSLYGGALEKDRSNIRLVIILALCARHQRREYNYICSQ